MVARWWILPMVLALCGCSTSRLESEWELTLEKLAGLPLEVAAHYPGPGAHAIGPRVQPYVFFNRPLADAEPRSFTEMSITGDSEQPTVLGALDWDDMGVTYRADDLGRGGQFHLSVPGVDDVGLEVDFSTTMSSDRAVFNLASGLVIEALGGSGEQAQALNDIFQPGLYPQWMGQFDRGFSGPDALPATTNLRFGPSRPADEGPPGCLLHREFGLSSVLHDVEIAADGSIDHEEDGVFLPIWSGSDVVVLYLDDVRVTATLDLAGGAGPALLDMSIEGVLGTRWLLQLARQGDSWAGVVNGAVLDVDTNGNDRPDSATFALHMEPTRLLPEDADL